MDLKEKTALITGASRGIGRSVALAFGRLGASVALHYHNHETAAANTLDRMVGGPHRLFQADIGDPDQVRALVQDVLAWAGKIDILVNNAGIYGLHPMDKLSYEEWLSVWDRMIAVNLSGVAHLSFLCAEKMREKGGKIINLSSRGAFRGEPEAPAYGAAKAGLNSLSQSMAQALAPFGVYVYSVAPGYIETEMTESFLKGKKGEAIRSQSPMGRVGRPEEVAELIAFLASENSDYMTGAIIDINGASYLRS